MAFLRGALKLTVSPNINRLLVAQIKQDRLFLRSFLPVVSSPRFATSTVSDTAGQVGSPKDPLDLSFNDAKAAFKSKTTWEVLRAYIVYTLCSSETLVENNAKVRLKKT